MKSEWDEDKNIKKKEKHNISFETEAYVFDDPYYVKMHTNVGRDEMIRGIRM